MPLPKQSLAKSFKESLPLLSSTLIGLALVAITAMPGQAVTFVANRVDLAADDEVDWLAVGSTVGPSADLFPPGDPSVLLSNAFTVRSEGDRSVGVEIPPTDQPGVLPPFVFETSSGDFIETNFADGDFVLLTGLRLGPPPAVGNPGPLTLTFAEPVFGAGTQIAAGGTTETYSANISAFDSANQLLGRFSAMGRSTEALDNSAVFLGVASEEANIARLELSTGLATAPFGINQLSLLTDAPATVPEPSLLLGILVLVAGGYRWRWQSQS